MEFEKAFVETKQIKLTHCKLLVFVHVFWKLTHANKQSSTTTNHGGPWDIRKYAGVRKIGINEPRGGKRSALNIPHHNETLVFWELPKNCCIIFATNSLQASWMSFDKTFMTQTNTTCRASVVLVWSLKITPVAFWWGSVVLQTRRYQPHRRRLVNWPVSGDGQPISLTHTLIYPLSLDVPSYTLIYTQAPSHLQ